MLLCDVLVRVYHYFLQISCTSGCHGTITEGVINRIVNHYSISWVSRIKPGNLPERVIL